MDKVIKSMDQKDYLSKDSCVKNEDHEPHKVIFLNFIDTRIRPTWGLGVPFPVTHPLIAESNG